MSMPPHLPLRISTAIGLFGALIAAGPAVGQNVGTAAAVNPASTGAGQTLSVGAQIIHNERIQTDTKGSLQLLFIDRTSMSIGPSSDIVIDDYVFDTKKNTGKMTVSVGKGVMRFIGGQISHEGNATVKTPSATIGIRGGVAFVWVEQGVTKATCAFGSCTFVASSGPNQGVPQTIRGGQTLTFDNSSSATSVAPTTSAEVKTLNELVSSKPGETAGVSTTTSAQLVSVSATSNVTAPILVTSQPASGGGSVPSPGTDPFRLTANGTVAPTDVTSSSQSAATAATIARSFGPAPFALSISGGGSSVPFVPVQFLTPGTSASNTYLSPMLGYRLPSSTDEPGVPARGATLQYGINIQGTGTGQSSWIYLATGSFLDDGHGGLLAQGGFSATRRVTPTSPVNFASSSYSSPAGAVTADGNRLPTSASLDNTYYNPLTNQYQPNDGIHNTVFNVGSGVQNYTFTATESQIPTPGGLGINREPFGTSTFTLNGYVGGIVRTRDTTNNVNFSNGFIVDNANGSPNDVTLQVNTASNRIQAGFNVIRQSGSAASGILSSAYLQFGSVDPAQQSRGTYVDFDNFGAREGTVRTDLQTGASDPVSTVNGGALNTSHQIFLAVTPAVAQTVFGGSGNTTTFCQCAYARWGFWSIDTSRGSTTTFSDTANLGVWVAGQPASGSDVAGMTGSATYTGHVVVNILTPGGSQYVDATNFTNTVDFGTRKGTVTVGTGAGGPLDRLNQPTIYSGTVMHAPSSPNFSGTLTGNVAGRNMLMNGTFFKGATSPVGEMGGSVRVIGTGGQAGYLASGIFAGKM